MARQVRVVRREPNLKGTECSSQVQHREDDNDLFLDESKHAASRSSAAGPAVARESQASK
jgi:hypothetical protein